MAHIQSLPHAVSGEGIYKVSIDRINDRAVNGRHSYGVPPGRYDIQVSLMLDVEWESAEGVQLPKKVSKHLQVEVLAGRTYQIAAKVDTSASEEQVARGDYWQPLLYRVFEAP